MNFLLVHGSWMNAGCWSLVEQSLRAKGHATHAVELPGHGGSDNETAGLTLQTYVDAVVQAAEQFVEPPVLVGHSMGGVVISQAAEQEPKRFSSLVYVAAYLPMDGQSLNDLAQADGDSLVGPNMVPAPDWSTLDLAESARGELFFHDVDPALAAAFLRSWKAEPVAPLTIPLKLSSEHFGSVQRMYIQTSKDRVVSPALQSSMLNATPTPSVEMATGHLPMLAAPETLVSVLLRGASV